MDLKRQQYTGTLLLLAAGCACSLLIILGISHKKYFLAIFALLCIAISGVFICLYFKEKLFECLKNNSGWYYLGFALICVLLREIINLALGGILPFASPLLIVLSLATKIAFAGGLFMLAWATQKRNVVRSLIDSLIVTLAVLVLAWSLHLHMHPFQSELMGKGNLAITLNFLLVVNGAASVFTLLGAFFYLITSQTDWNYYRSAPWVLGGFACLFVVHFLRIYSAGFPDWNPRSPLWFILILNFVVASIILVLAGMLWHDPPHANDPHRPLSDFRQRLMTLWFPYSAALGVGFTLAIMELRSSSPMATNLLPVVILMIAVVSRQLLTMRDNLQLSDRLSEANANLEQNVMARTQHLATLHNITSTLNSSLDRSSVLKIALEQIMDVTRAEEGAIWLRQHKMLFNKNSADADGTEWHLAYAKGFTSLVHENALRNLAVGMAEERNLFLSNPQSTFEQTYGFSPNSGRVMIVPIRSGGVLLGVQALILENERFNYDTRSVVESVALEVGTSLQNAHLYQEARQRADRDGVTGLFNHRSIREQLTSLLQRSKQSQMPFSVMMMDLDDFKYFNDTYGHPTGDDALRTVARQLEKVCGSHNPIGRYGGDEFIILLPGQNHEQARQIYMSLKTALQQEHFEAAAGVHIPISMSYGWAVFPDDGQSALELVTAADANLYRYKERGGLIENTQDNVRDIAGMPGKSSAFGVLDALITAIDNKDHYTRKHSDEVAHYALLIAQELGYSAESQRAVRISALLHDVGKIAVPDDILRHPGKLSREDWEIMKQHPSFGAMIVKDLPHIDEVISGIRSHHERWDGKGYPDQLSGTNIPIMGRLLAVPDTYSALTTNRPYRKGHSPKEALLEIEHSINTQFDPVIAKAFARVMERELASEIKEENVSPLGAIATVG